MQHTGRQPGPPSVVQRVHVYQMVPVWPLELPFQRLEAVCRANLCPLVLQSLSFHAKVAMTRQTEQLSYFVCHPCIVVRSQASTAICETDYLL